MGKCILLGFHSRGGSSQTFEQWARENLVTINTTIEPATTPYSEWAKQNFITSNSGGTITPPASETKAILIEWAKENFIRTTS